MICLACRILINAPVRKVRNWFHEEFIKRYAAIHLQDHQGIKMISEGVLRVGSVLFVKERFGKSVHIQAKIQITELNDTSVRFQALFPYSLIGLKGGFILYSVREERTELLVENCLGRTTPFISKIFDFAAKILFSPPQLQIHMEQEAVGIKREIEKNQIA